MDNLLNEIKHLAQQGLEKSIISRDENYKEIFLQIMLKSETAIEKFSQLSTSQKSIYEKVSSSVRTHDRIDEARKSNMYLIAYCFSRFEHTSLFPQYNQTKSFDIAAEKLGVKKNTLKKIIEITLMPIMTMIEKDGGKHLYQMICKDSKRFMI